MEKTRVAGPAERPGRRGGSVVGPLLLIGAGLLLLGRNAGLLGDDFLRGLWQFWPVLLILLGIELALGRGSAAGTVGALILVGLAVGVLVWTMLVGRVAPWDWWDGDRGRGFLGPAVSEQVVEELGDAGQATVSLRYGAGRLRLAALPADSESLLAADLARDAETTVERAVERRGDRVEVTLRARRGAGGDDASGVGDWSLRLSPRLPLELRVQAGAGRLDLDLTDLAVRRLDVQAGAGEATVTLPSAAGRTTASVRAGVSDVTIVVPPGVAARLRVNLGLVGLEIDESRFRSVGGGLYQSPDYETATNRVDLEVQSGVGRVSVR